MDISLEELQTPPTPLDRKKTPPAPASAQPTPGSILRNLNRSTWRTPSSLRKAYSGEPALSENIESGTWQVRLEALRAIELDHVEDVPALVQTLAQQLQSPQSQVVLAACALAQEVSASLEPAAELRPLVDALAHVASAPPCSTAGQSAEASLASVFSRDAELELSAIDTYNNQSKRRVLSRLVLTLARTQPERAGLASIVEGLLNDAEPAIRGEARAAVAAMHEQGVRLPRLEEAMSPQALTQLALEFPALGADLGLKRPRESSPVGKALLRRKAEMQAARAVNSPRLLMARRLERDVLLRRALPAEPIERPQAVESDSPLRRPVPFELPSVQPLPSSQKRAWGRVAIVWGGLFLVLAQWGEPYFSAALPAPAPAAPQAVWGDMSTRDVAGLEALLRAAADLFSPASPPLPLHPLGRWGGPAEPTELQAALVVAGMFGSAFILGRSLLCGGSTGRGAVFDDAPEAAPVLQATPARAPPKTPARATPRGRVPVEVQRPGEAPRSVLRSGRIAAKQQARPTPARGRRVEGE